MAGGGKKSAGSSPGGKTRNARALWITAMVFVSGWMFFLGVLVGRETAPIRYDVRALKERLAEAKAALFKSEVKRFKIPAGSQEDPMDLSFYDALKESAETPVEKRRKPAVQKFRMSKKPAATPSAFETPSPSVPETKKIQREGKPAGSSSGRLSEAPEKRLTLQVAAVPDPDDAGRLVADLKKRGYPAYSEAVMIPGKGVWYRVRIGSFTSRKGASVMLRQLKKERFQPIIVNRNAK
jgi:cell division septation protein DedD